MQQKKHSVESTIQYNTLEEICTAPSSKTIYPKANYSSYCVKDVIANKSWLKVSLYKAYDMWTLSCWPAKSHLSLFRFVAFGLASAWHLVKRTNYTLRQITLHPYYFLNNFVKLRSSIQNYVVVNIEVFEVKISYTIKFCFLLKG